jgi:predicted nuclease with RNAse H fold
MTRLSPKEFAEELATKERPFVGLDIAVNLNKGLRFVARIERGICELTLRFRRDIRLATSWPFLDLPIPTDAGSCLLTCQRLFHLHEEEACLVSECFQRAIVFAVDSPCSLAPDFERRASELAWHRLEITSSDSDSFLKKKNRGILWSPRQSEVETAVSSYFSPKNESKPTCQQLLLLGQSLWMFVGLWVYQVLDTLGTPRIEVYPHASRVICQEIAKSEINRDSLLAQVNRWSRAFSFDDFIARKSETNDAAISSFTAFLYQSALTEELAPGEIVIPRRPIVGQTWNVAKQLTNESTESQGAIT